METWNGYDLSYAVDSGERRLFEKYAGQPAGDRDAGPRLRSLFKLEPEAGFDLEFFLQLLSERREKRKRMGVITTRQVATRERNEGLDLMCMILCAHQETYHGRIDLMELQTCGGWIGFGESLNSRHGRDTGRSTRRPVNHFRLSPGAEPVRCATRKHTLAFA